MNLAALILNMLACLLAALSFLWAAGSLGTFLAKLAVLRRARPGFPDCFSQWNY
jgi:hypothetical protein